MPITIKAGILIIFAKYEIINAIPQPLQADDITGSSACGY
jgi:hypothetical protein